MSDRINYEGLTVHEKARAKKYIKVLADIEAYEKPLSIPGVITETSKSSILNKHYPNRNFSTREAVDFIKEMRTELDRLEIASPAPLLEGDDIEEFNFMAGSASAYIDSMLSADIEQLDSMINVINQDTSLAKPIDYKTGRDRFVNRKTSIPPTKKYKSK